MALNAHIQKQSDRASLGWPLTKPTISPARKCTSGIAPLCHGLPGQPPTDYATIMFPRPPQLFRGKGVTDDPVGESYWKTANGIRPGVETLPGFKTKLTDTQLWPVSQLLAHANEISDPVKQALGSRTSRRQYRRLGAPAAAPNSKM